MAIETSRRDFLAGSLGAAPLLGAITGATAVTAPVARAAVRLAQDEAYWSTVAKAYDVARDPINLEGAFCGIMPRPVLEAYKANIDLLNSRNSVYARTEYEPRVRETVRETVAQHLGVAAAEIALTRNATEALQNLIVNYSRLAPGDRVLYADLDYPAMQYAMDHLVRLRGAAIVKIAVPEPPSREAVIAAYRSAMDAQPRLKLILLTYVSHRTGLALPVKEIVAAAKARGIDVILDAAHAWGNLDFDFQNLNVDFAGFNIHKWIQAPLGAGFMFVRKERLPDIAPHFSDRDFAASDVRSRVHSGTPSIPSIMTVPAALAFQDQVGWSARSARLRFLRDYWVSAARRLNGIEILTPDEPGMSGAITAFRLGGVTSAAANSRIAEHLLKTHRIFTVQRTGVAAGACIRVTPTVHTRLSELDAFARALEQISKRRPSDWGDDDVRG